MEHIILATDGSPNAEAALDHAIVLADRMDATVHGVYSVYLRPNADYGIKEDLGTVRTAEEKSGEGALDTVETRCEQAGVEVETELRSGPAPKEIEQVANDVDADLIVMGTQGGGGLRGLLLGSTTVGVLRRVDRPVLAIPRGAPAPSKGYEDILIATDASERAEQAADVAFDWAEAFGAAVHGLFVVDPNFARAEEVEEALGKRGKRALEELESRATDRGIEFTWEIEAGIPHERINEYGEENDLDLIVVGSHGRSGVERSFLGSVSERTLRTTDHPILIV